MAETALKGLGCDDRELSILVTGNERIRGLNAMYRSIDRPTDVLSFPMDDPSMLGDVVISVEKAALQAEQFGVTLAEETGRLVVHGVLHLLGYDHARGGRQAAKMKRAEEELMASLREDGFF
ncbi:MAG: rRNA maturation RNase YbeY [Thermodesulfobacteriota bacterium]|nr:MAG: rRNA maturation RNase YbeY [Thermodesulfobacteriota bacterium]